MQFLSWLARLSRFARSSVVITSVSFSAAISFFKSWFSSSFSLTLISESSRLSASYFNLENYYGLISNIKRTSAQTYPLG